MLAEREILSNDGVVQSRTAPRDAAAQFAVRLRTDSPNLARRMTIRLFGLKSRYFPLFELVGTVYIREYLPAELSRWGEDFTLPQTHKRIEGTGRGRGRWMGGMGGMMKDHGTRDIFASVDGYMVCRLLRLPLQPKWHTQMLMHLSGSLHPCHREPHPHPKVYYATQLDEVHHCGAKIGKINVGVGVLVDLVGMEETEYNADAAVILDGGRAAAAVDEAGQSSSQVCHITGGTVARARACDIVSGNRSEETLPRSSDGE
ncbi:hypothetical protein EV421DRAFT_1740258 [Armillaria borealis]|uniref:Uncharacterized protein n=1 Tax=Armillaria borealis TaxID=47425 RepID=A0AA39J4N7_9AGAR|nr:hypothetical protein EV421DRAFT_1740258 [Armillaria borealis]